MRFSAGQFLPFKIFKRYCQVLSGTSSYSCSCSSAGNHLQERLIILKHWRNHSSKQSGFINWFSSETNQTLDKPWVRSSFSGHDHLDSLDLKRTKNIEVAITVQIPKGEASSYEKFITVRRR